MQMCLYVHFMRIYVYESIFYMGVYYLHANFYTTCRLMRMHACLGTHACTYWLINVGTRVCAGCRFYSYIFLTTYVNLIHYNYVFTIAPEIRKERIVSYLPMGVWFMLQRHGLFTGLFYCFIETVCFTCMYFVLQQWRTKNCEPEWHNTYNNNNNIIIIYIIIYNIII